MNDPAAANIEARSYFPNLRAAAIWGVVAASGFFVLATRNFGLQGLLGGAVGLFALQACWSFVLGVRVLEDRVALPRQLFNPLPLLVFARKSVSLKLLSDLTSAGRFLGFDVVMLTLPDAAIPVLFSTRSARLAFFEAVKRRVPDMRIYRAI